MLRYSFIPSSSLSLEQLRLALMNYVVSLQREEGFVIRIEDTDQTKIKEGIDSQNIAILELFGIQAKELLYQSKNFKFHSAMAIDLLHRKKAFNCFCTKEELEIKKARAKEQKRLYVYDGTCEQLPAEMVIDNPNPFRVRIKSPKEKICFEDMIQGDLCFLPEEIGSFVILNTDKTPTHEFATAVDDMLSDISVVIDKEEHIESTPKEIYIRSLLGYTKEIEYAHIPPLQNANLDLKELLSEGILPQALANYLLILGSKKEAIFTLEDAKEHFDIKEFTKSAVFDKEELLSINQKHLMLLDNKELSRYVGFADAEIGKVAKLYLDRAKTTKELKEIITTLFTKKDLPQDFQVDAIKIKELVTQAPYFDKYEKFEAYLLKQSSLKRDQLRKILSYFFITEDQAKIKDIYNSLKNYIKEVFVL
ncbi:Glutamyl-tRNA(Gln) synthetase [hydrothermal vent metagenome]|uniref:Glutamyl-tRNA(Gln) synthetase n=1 Tax=hydrothermal vent metagenome TaxID=652676 RepID=A0A1W1B8H7_9ZZZZ